MSRRRASRWAEAMRVTRVDRRLALPTAAQAPSNTRDETATRPPASEKVSRSLVRTLNDRSSTGRSRGVELWAEDESVFRQQLEYLDLSAEAPTVSTIAVDFSSDGKLFASTHGDHTVKITSFLQGKVVQTLRGHPRTPWTVKFHPKNSRIVASGCIGFEAKVWNASTGQCLHTATLEAAIISLSFHPSGRMIAMASSLYVYLWDYNNKARPFIAWAHSHTLRCVRFTPDGKGIIVGAANSSSSAPSPRNQTQPLTVAARGGAGGRAGAAASAPAPAAARGEAGGGAGVAAPAAAPAAAPSQPAEVTFRLQVWDFSLEAALEENIAAAMTRERVLLSQTLLYNDGGFDVSQDGLWLCAIAGLRERAGGNRPSAATNRDSNAAGTLPLSTPATTMATVMEVEEADGEEEEPAAVAVAGAHIDDAGGAVGNLRGVCRGAGDAAGRSSSSDPLMAPQNGSHLGGWGQQTPPVTKIAGAAASNAQETAMAAGAPPLPAKEARESNGGESGICLQGAAGGREESTQEEPGKGSVLAPWPSRARPRPYFSVAFAGEDLGKGGEAAENGGGPLAAGSTSGVAEGSATAGVAGRSADARSEPPPFTPPPFTPSPRITLKRRLSGSWLNAVSGGRSSGGGGGGGGGGGAGSSGGFWGRELRKGGSPRLGSSERGGRRATQRIEDRPPPLPPPPPGAQTGGKFQSAASPPLSTTSSSAAHPRQPPARARASPPLRASSDPYPASSSGGLRISLPLLQPPPAVVAAAGLDAGASAVGPPAGELDQGEQQRLLERRQQQQGGLVPPTPPPPPPPSQPVFFLQVPATSEANVAQGGLEGRGWDAQYLSAGATGENALQEARVTYGRTVVTARNSSTGGAGHGHGGRVHGGRQEGNTDDVTVRGVHSQEVGSMFWESTSTTTSSSAPTSFGRDHRHVLPPASASAPAGKFVPHLVLVSLNLEDGRGLSGGGSGEKVARVVCTEAMDIFTAKQVTSVKLSPSARYILLGVGVRGDGGDAGGGQAPHLAASASHGDAAGLSAASQPRFPLSSIYRSADLQPVNSMPAAEEDVNIACFHPEPGMGCVYGTKQGQVGLVRLAH